MNNKSSRPSSERFFRNNGDSTKGGSLSADGAAKENVPGESRWSALTTNKETGIDKVLVL
jgi:hypothetical protein